MQLHLDIEHFPTTSYNAVDLAAWLHDLPLPARQLQLLPALHSAVHMLEQQISRGLGMHDFLFNLGADPQGFLCVVRLPIFLVKWLLLIAGSVHEQSATGKQPVP
jgi:hypothetical protein